MSSIKDRYEFYHYSFSEILRSPELIRSVPGVYSWVFIPPIETESKVGFLNSMNAISSMVFSIKRSGFVGDSHIEIVRKGFTESGLFSLGSSKWNDLDKISDNIKQRELFKEIFQGASRFTNQLYIGKAINMRSRIKDHISGKSSSLIKNCEENGIDKKSLSVNIMYDKNTESLEENEKLPENFYQIAEEILQRISQPGFVGRKG